LKDFKELQVRMAAEDWEVPPDQLGLEVVKDREGIGALEVK
jgi:hypothetical protein